MELTAQLQNSRFSSEIRGDCDILWLATLGVRRIPAHSSFTNFHTPQKLMSPDLQPPRFGLKALMWSITLISVFCGAFNYFGSHAAAVLSLLALAIAAHIAGNAIGTRLRADGDRATRDRPTPHTRRGAQVIASDFAPATQLRQRSPLGRPIVFATLAGTILGAVLGGIAFVRIVRQPVTIPSVALGVTAAAVLGGIWSFVAASFLQVAATAVWQATREPKK